MNFLSHYYLLEERNNTAKVVGNLLPDLMRGFTKIYRTEIEPNKDSLNENLIAGISFHLLVDKLFHEHEFFLNHCENIKQIIKDRALDSNKSFIVAHVMVELIIDQFLMEEHRDLANEFYEQLDQALKQDTLESLKITLNKQNSSKIFRIFKSFIEYKYAYKIVDSKGVSEALQHIIGKRIGIDFNSVEWHKAIQEASTKVKAGLPNFLIDLKQAIQNA